MDLPDWIDRDTGIGAAIVATLTAVGIVVKARSSKAASARRSLAKETVAGLDHDARVAPLLRDMLSELQARVESAEERVADVEGEAKKCHEERATDRAECKREIEERSERHRAQLETLTQHTELVTEELKETRRRLRVLERHPRVVDVSEDEDDTGLHRLDESLRTVRNTPTPPGGWRADGE